MNKLKIEFKLDLGVELPKVESEEASGFDVRATKILSSYKGSSEASAEKLEMMKSGFERSGYIKIRPFERILFGSGITVANIPSSLELQVRTRSGKALKTGLFVANSPGTVDSDYRGEIGIIIYNSTPVLIKLEKDERIAQIVPSVKASVEIASVENIEDTARGSGGFGSTGLK